jgi:hypothetical protein
MIEKPLDVLSKYEIRKTKKQKDAFIAAVSDYTNRAGYTVRVEKGSLGSRNIVIGDAEKAKYLVTAHYDTCAWMPLPNFITPCNFFVYLVYQLLLTGVIFCAATGIGAVFSLLLGDPALAGITSFIMLYVILGLMIAGPANRHTANDNTSGVVTVLEIMTSMPENLRQQVAFVLCDLEEAGLVGSSSYRSKHKKQTQNQIVLNLDCVGDGDEILLFPTGKLKKNAAEMGKLSKLCGCMGAKRLQLKKKGFGFYPSDQASFPNGVGIAAFHKAKFLGFWLGRIHTSRDTVLDMTNVNILRAAIISLIGNL